MQTICFVKLPQSQGISIQDNSTHRDWIETISYSVSVSQVVVVLPLNTHQLQKTSIQSVMDMVIFRTIFFELLVFFTFALLTLHFTY